MNLLPWPKEISYETGCFEIDCDTVICVDPLCGRQGFDTAMLLQREIGRLSAHRLPISARLDVSGTSCILLRKKDVAPNAYTLDVRPGTIEIAAGTDAGLFYGAQTLRQLVATESPCIPALSIRDWPDFEVRGFMHDVTRGKVPTLETLKDLADRAAYYKLNQLQLYIEHTFAFHNMSEVWRDADPLTAQEILELDEYCASRYIELVPTIATFGHLYELLRSQTYRHLCEIEIDGAEPFTWPDRQLHHTLDVSNPESFALVRGMLDEFLPLFTSDKVNICCDETFDLGEGRNRAQAQRVGKGRLYMDFLLKIMGYVKGRGKTVLFWDDILLEHPEYLRELPKDAVCLTWQYAAQVQEEKFKRIHDTGLRQYVCPGVSAWNRLAADMDTATANIVGSARYAQKYAAVGLLNTDWGDYGHVNLLTASLPGMILGACAAWNCDASQDAVEMDRMTSILEYGDESGTAVALQRELGGLCKLSWAQLVAWYCDKFLGRRFEYPDTNGLGEIPAEEIRRCTARAQEIAGAFARLAPRVPETRRLEMEELVAAAEGTALLNLLLLALQKFEFRQAAVDTALAPAELAGRMERWVEGFSRLWRARNKESELAKIRSMLFAVCDYLRGC